MPLTVSKLDGLKCRFEFLSPSAQWTISSSHFPQFFHSQWERGQGHAKTRLNMEFSVKSKMILKTQWIELTWFRIDICFVQMSVYSITYVAQLENSMIHRFIKSECTAHAEASLFYLWRIENEELWSREINEAQVQLWSSAGNLWIITNCLADRNGKKIPELLAGK